MNGQRGETMRAAIYARYSTEMQSDRSIEDQVALCEAYAAREGLTVVARFEDRMRSGGSSFGRDGLAGLMKLASEGGADVIVVEALDRISRDMEDLAGIYKRLSFAGVAIRAVHEGQVNTMLVGLRGLVGQLYREDLANKTRRGLSGRVAEGRLPAKPSYGYRNVPGEKGRRVIHEEEAETIRLIFSLYLDGMSTRRIAIRLNEEGVRAPRTDNGWKSSTIKGGGRFGAGIIMNPIYCGRMVWGRRRNVRNPETGKIVQRDADAGGQIVREMPELAIVSRETWEAAQRKVAERSAASYCDLSAPSFALSGLLKCGGCGRNLVGNGTSNGRRRVVCCSVQHGRLCPISRSYYLDQVQTVIIDALRAELRHPAVIAEFVRTYHEARAKRVAGEGRRRAGLERRIAELTRERDRLIECIAKGHGDPAVLGPRSTTAHQEIHKLSAELACKPEPVNVIALHPATLARYEALLTDLQSTLAGSNPAVSGPLRELIAHVTVHPGPKRGKVRIEITGRLNALLGAGFYPDGMCAPPQLRTQLERSPQLAEALFSIVVAA